MNMETGKIYPGMYFEIFPYITIYWNHKTIRIGWGCWFIDFWKD